MNIIETLQGMGITLTDEQQTQLKKVVGENYVPRADFNAKVTRLRDVEKDLAEAKKIDTSALESERDDYKGKYEGLLKANSDKEAIAAFKEKLGNQCKDPDYVLYKLGGVDKIERDKEGKFTNLDTLVNTAKETYKEQFDQKLPFFTSSSKDETHTKEEGAQSAANAALRGLYQ